MKFLHLSNRIISKSFIQSIQITPKQYIIHLQSTGLDGFVALGFGLLHSYTNTIHINKNTYDYEIVRKWIEKDTHSDLKL